jgi:hypothetical protein
MKPIMPNVEQNAHKYQVVKAPQVHGMEMDLDGVQGTASEHGEETPDSGGTAALRTLQASSFIVSSASSPK